MVKHAWSLVFFTILSQMSAGAFIVIKVLDYFLVDSDSYIGSTRNTTLVLLAIMIVSLISSFTHLGKPQNSIFAIRNLKHSWLSKEIYFMSLFTGLLFFQAVLFDWIHNISFLTGLFSFLGIVFSFFFILSMIKLYQLKTVILWNSSYTFLNFANSSLLLGTILITLISLINTGIVNNILIIVISVLLFLQLGVLAFNYRRMKSNSLFVIFLYSLALAVSLGIIFGLFESYWIFVLSIILTLFGIIFERYLFYASYKNVGV